MSTPSTLQCTDEPVLSRVVTVALGLVLTLAVLGCGHSATTESPEDHETVERTLESNQEPQDEPAPVQRPIGEQAFRDAAFQGNLATVTKAIEQGIDVNGKDADRRTALMLAAYDDHAQVVSLLLNHDARCNDRDATNRTALIYAASGPNAETVKILLAAGADPDIADNVERWTALMFAAAEGNVEVVKLLLDHGADKTWRDVDGDSAEKFAADGGHQEVVQLLQAK